MKVYFTGSLHNRDIDRELYQKIVTIIESMGHSVSTFALDKTRQGLDALSSAQRTSYYHKLKKNIERVDVVVAEVSYPSTINIGHEVSLALDKGKSTVAIYQKGREPGILQGIDSDKFVLLEYSIEDIKSVIDYGLDEAQAMMDVRFNFFVSPQISQYLDEIAKKKRLPRAVYLRRLIEEDMKNNKEYNSSN